MNHLWQIGIIAKGRHGSGSRKLRTHIFKHKNNQEHKLDVGQEYIHSKETPMIHSSSKATPTKPSQTAPLTGDNCSTIWASCSILIQTSPLCIHIVFLQCFYVFRFFPFMRTLLIWLHLIHIPTVKTLWPNRLHYGTLDISIQHIYFGDTIQPATYLIRNKNSKQMSTQIMQFNEKMRILILPLTLCFPIHTSPLFIYRNSGNLEESCSPNKKYNNREE